MIYQCPKCGSEQLDVVVETWAELVQDHDDENFETEVKGSQDWDSTSPMYCRACSYRGQAATFEIAESTDAN